MTSIDIDDDPPLELDDTDRAVLDARIRNPRMDVREIAAETGIVANRVEDRLDRLEDAGVIRGYTARVDYDAMGYDVTAVLRLSVDGDDILKRVRDEPRFVAVYAVTGNDDIVAIGKFRDTDDLNATATELLTDDTVQSLNISVALDAIQEFEPFTFDGE